LVGDHDQAIAVFEKAIEKDPGFWPSHLLLALSYHVKGLEKESREAVKNALAENKNLASEKWENIIPYKDPEAKQKMVVLLTEMGIYK
jgi:tetratricopeptide (TPR) repeat protein